MNRAPQPHPRHMHDAPESFASDRPLWRSVLRGARLRCPRCGEGRLYRSFLKPREACACCGLAFDGHRADDLPPYLTILIAAHLLAPPLLAVERLSPPPLWVGFLIWPLAAIALCLLLLPSVKGAVIGQQWAWRMHGFGEGGAQPSAPDRPSDPAADYS